MNIMRPEVIRNARELESVDGSLLADDAPLCRDMSLQQVMQRVHDIWKFAHDVAINTVWMHVTYRGIRSLLAKQPVADMIVDMASIYATLGAQDVAYLPTTVRFLDVAKSQISIGRQYVKLRYLPGDATALWKVDNVAVVISQVPGYSILDDIGRFTYSYIDVPRQTNGYDCGMFGIK
ncbi:hypothetical protein RND81_13G117000 [Saponaria officinalis]|uniref:Ubiquitin-like protease family profile domain-containing protein n=1 Tax=Saponaria officinalis TaxID=3572 RepID=A0AAW1GWK7_SAPOF